MQVIATNQGAEVNRENIKVVVEEDVLLKLREDIDVLEKMAEEENIDDKTKTAYTNWVRGARRVLYDLGLSMYSSTFDPLL